MNKEQVLIQEEYVNFEIAKLLKEKGFDINCWHYYKDGVLHNYYYQTQPNNKSDNIAAPTQQMAMRWLREIHNIHIVAYPYTDKEGHHFGFTFDKYAYGCWHELAIYITDSWNSYESAVSAAIKYCLTNLI